MGNLHILKDQLSFCALNQGKRKSKITGEEFGKIFHEYPGEHIRDLSTRFNGCDTTALFLIGHEIYHNHTKDNNLFDKYKKQIKRATDYILSHLDDNYFIEDPSFCGNDKFALKVTYWKDSALHNRVNGEAKYPIVYPLAHIQNMRALESAAKLLRTHSFNQTIEGMKSKLDDLFDDKNGAFYTAVDSDGPIEGISSDSLHALFYIDPEDISKEKVRKIAQSSLVLATPIGYRSLDPKIKSIRKYHSEAIWPFEQAIIHKGARKFGLRKVMKIASRVVKLGSNHEIAFMKNKEIEPSGCTIQLWTIAAQEYFRKPRQSFSI